MSADSPSALLQRIVIVGGGTAGWMAAAALAKTLRGKVQITLIESEEIGTVGVGEASIPMLAQFNALVGIDEDEFLRETGGTFKLGIEFVNWRRTGHRYTHGFGWFGPNLQSVRFENYWVKLHAQGRVGELACYSINHQAAAAGRFMRPTAETQGTPMADVVHAFHFDALRYARLLRRHAEPRGVERIEGKVVDVALRAGTGHVNHVTLQDGRVFAAELFIDCSGFHAVLIEGALHTGYEDWSHWLPCDRAIAVPSQATAAPLLYTRSTAHAAGWQWRIPLQHRTGNGHVFCSGFTSEDEATAVLLNQLDGEPLAVPRTFKFVTGMRRKAWQGNVVALGLAAGFMEPLESTSIHLIQTAIGRLINFFPGREFSAPGIDEFNRLTRSEYERIRDFIVLHYHQTERDDTPFWRHCRTMDVPDTLRRKMALYRSHGRVFREADELFTEASWHQVMHGQGLTPVSHYPLVDLLDEGELIDHFQSTEALIERCVQAMPSHADYIARHCAAAR